MEVEPLTNNMGLKKGVIRNVLGNTLETWGTF